MITASELDTIMNALHVAAEAFDRDAAAMREGGLLPSFVRLAEQFDQQASQSRALYDKLEDLSDDEIHALAVLTVAPTCPDCGEVTS